MTPLLDGVDHEVANGVRLKLEASDLELHPPVVAIGVEDVTDKKVLDSPLCS